MCAVAAVPAIREIKSKMTKPNLTIAIVGGVAGGASAATRARRMNEYAEIILFEKDEYVSFANCGLPYYIGGEIAEREKLLVAPRELLERRFRLNVRTRQEVLKIDREAKTLAVLDHVTGATYEQRYDKLILSPGARPIVPSIEGVNAPNVFTLRNLTDTDRIRAAADASTARRAVVVGAGFIGIEMVEQLVSRGFEVTLAELQPQILPLLDPEIVQPLEEALVAQGVRLLLGDGIARVLTGGDGRATGVELQSGAIANGDIVILGLGVRPNTQLAQDAGLEIGPSGGIVTNRFLQSSDSDIYAVGDAAEYIFGPTGTSLRIALAGPANRAGRLAGEHAATGKCAPMSDVMGTAIVRLFDRAAALTGLSETLARRMGVDVRSVTIVANHHAGYFPNASPLTLKLVYAPNTGRVLGAQAVGREGVDKRIDAIATAMALKATVRDLAGLDLAYAPPFGSAKDPLHMAAFAACNQLDGVEDFVHSDIELTDFQVIDVRTAAEVKRNPLAGVGNAINIPLDELRDRLNELDHDAPTVVSCGMGLRAHVALRILKQHGFRDVANLSGGATIRRQAVR
jgi:NADPH-dependent 2,4-dienoyl-CoA reductase/sulfur reductase-like enzyme/rhodanese-related sulfurtransferase